MRQRFLEWVETNPHAQARLGNPKLEGRIVGWPLNTYQGPSRNYGTRVLLVGDAASLVDPINGEGIHTALESGYLAAKIADKALQTDDFSAAALSQYGHRWRAAFELDLRTSDLYVSIAKNRSLVGFWLSLIKLMGEAARKDRDYAETLAGILAGVVPVQRSLSVTFIAKTLLHSPAFYGTLLGVPLREGPADVTSWSVDALGDIARTLMHIARQSAETLEWAHDIAAKSCGVLAGVNYRSNATRVSSSQLDKATRFSYNYSCASEKRLQRPLKRARRARRNCPEIGAKSP